MREKSADFQKLNLRCVQSYVHRLAGADRLQSQVPPGTREGIKPTPFSSFSAFSMNNGRSFVEGSDRLERFYCNEAETARLFRRSVGALAQEQRLSSNVNEKTEPEWFPSTRRRSPTA
jgi:hypothetical protein